MGVRPRSGLYHHRVDSRVTCLTRLVGPFLIVIQRQYLLQACERNPLKTFQSCSQRPDPRADRRCGAGSVAISRKLSSRTSYTAYRNTS